MRLLSKSVLNVLDKDNIKSLNIHNSATCYPNGLITIIREDSKYAILYIEPAKALTEKNEIPLREITLHCSTRSIDTFTTLFRGAEPTNVLNTIVYSANRKDATFTQSSDIINTPGSGCDKNVLSMLTRNIEHIHKNAESLRNRRLPVGQAVLLVGPPGSGKTSVVSHATMQSQASSLHSFVLQDAKSIAMCLWKFNRSTDTFTRRTVGSIASFNHVGTCVVLVNDIDRLIQSKILSTSEILSTLDELLDEACLVVFTANSITPFDPAVLSRLKIQYIGEPNVDQISEIVKLYYDTLSDETIASWVKEISSEVKDLRLLRRCLVSMSDGETLPQAWRRVCADETAAKERADLDGNKYVTT